MKLIAKLEKNKTFWYLLGISFLFFLLRLPSLLEPNWYGDEGIYQVIGQAIHSGRLLYSEIFDNKPPFLYLLYAIFNGDQFSLRLFSLISGLFAVNIFFYLARLLFKRNGSIFIATIVFALLFAIPMTEGNIANAENFMLPLIVLAGVLVYFIVMKKTFRTNIRVLDNKFFLPVTAGVLLSVSFLFKIVAIFDLAAFTLFLLIATLPETFSFTRSTFKKQWNASLVKILPLIIGFIAPVLITAFYFLMSGAFSDFIRASFFSNVGYVGWKNNFIIPQGLLISKLIFLLFFVVFLYRKRTTLTKPEIFIFLWFAFSIFNTYFSGRPYTHYVLVSLPAICLLIGLCFESTKKSTKNFAVLVLIVSLIVLNNTFRFNIRKSMMYYGNAIAFLNGGKDATSYQAFFDKKTPRDYMLATFVKTHTNENDTIFLWGDSAQIYALSNKLPPGRYTVAYHISQYKNGINETQEALSRKKPKYIIILKESRPFPFNMSSYDNKFAIEGATIYERSF